MPINIHISGDTAEMALHELRAFAAPLSAVSIAAVPAPSGVAELGKPSAAPAAAVSTESTPAGTSATTAASPSEEPKKPSRSRKPAATKAVDAPEPDSAETAAQDAADEAAETAGEKAAAEEKAAAKGEAAPLTHDDVRGVMSKYVAAFGMPATMEDGPKILKLLFGEGVEKVSQIPDDQDALAKSVAAFEEALAKNPFKRAGV